MRDTLREDFVVSLDDSMVRVMHDAAIAGVGLEPILEAARRGFESADHLSKERDRILADLPGHFPEHAMMADPAYWSRIEAIRDNFFSQASDSIEGVKRFLPGTKWHGYHFTMHLVPGFSSCYGPMPRHQLFSLRGRALPEEAYLFHLHVSFHELTNVFDTDLCVRAAASPRTADLFRHYLLTLIRNEGLANYIVLGRLRQFQETHEGYEYLYFKYANLIADMGARAQAVKVCRQIVASLRPDNFRLLIGRISELLKNERLPVINLVGIHLAEAIARQHGERSLIESAAEEPQVFFRLFCETADPLVAELQKEGAAAAFTTVPSV